MARSQLAKKDDYMEASVLPWLSCLAFAAIITAFLLGYLQQRNSLLAWVLLGYFGACLVFIAVRWYCRLDLAVYDVEKYQTWGAQIAALLRVDFWGNLPNLWMPFAAYTFPLGLLYAVFGISEPLGQLLSTVFGLGVILNLHRLATLWFDRRTADHTALFAALYPYGWVLGGTLNRDMLIAFCITLLFRALSELQNQERKGSRLGFGVIVFGSLLYMTLLRPPLFILGALAVFIFWVISPQATPRRRPLWRTVRVMALGLVMFLSVASFFMVDKYYAPRTNLEQGITGFSDVDRMNRRLEISENAESAYLKGVRYSSYLEVLTAMPVATGYFLFSPLPWQVSSPKQVLGILDSTWLILVSLYFLKGIKPLYHRHRKLTWALLTFLVMGITTSSVLQANAGSAMRHRTMFTFLMFPVAVHGMTRRRASRSAFRAGNRLVELRRPPAGRCD
jgi:ABC-type multidrug transport system fused ATPase/permease subunit